MSNKYRKEILIEKIEWVELSHWYGDGKTHRFPKLGLPWFDDDVEVYNEGTRTTGNLAYENE
jgi:hypothetical protein